MTDHMEWQLQLDMLIAEANVYANEATRELLKLAPLDLFSILKDTQAFDAAERWAVIQDEIQHHINTAKGKSS